ncbi:hypothetical protein PMAYCL1PPCAC_24406 [Pristionchus mayeri]|uniref:SCP domain-containing protein n=1 Tax=Pristionchus mayeri TaxID=1317129 RepID=A0AAN5I8I4_9BILA|nr:hypothetical protein PMAYCL1PPCAC_24406 [Pristionchus mayeri]
MLLLLPLALLLLIQSTLAQSQCSGGIPAKEVKSILEVHNSLRQSISSGKFVAKDKKMPAAKGGIPDLTWDCGIEQSAQKHASRCQFEHSTGLNNLGENLYMMWSSAKVSIDGQGRDASNSWANEFQQKGWSDIEFTMEVYNSGVGHATQMAWQKTTKIGCGIALCDGEKSVLVTCQYRDAGNYINEYVYFPK